MTAYFCNSKSLCCLPIKKRYELLCNVLKYMEDCHNNITTTISCNKSSSYNNILDQVIEYMTTHGYWPHNVTFNDNCSIFPKVLILQLKSHIIHLRHILSSIDKITKYMEKFKYTISQWSDVEYMLERLENDTEITALLNYIDMADKCKNYTCTVKNNNHETSGYYTDSKTEMICDDIDKMYIDIMVKYLTSIDLNDDDNVNNDIHDNNSLNSESKLNKLINERNHDDCVIFQGDLEDYIGYNI